ncbi:MAG: flagellar motor switch protein FliN [Melioribacteraceae bacterium]|nr:flagellar motor switch protein FliN [Melioribacteraceae bacterium]
MADENLENQEENAESQADDILNEAGGGAPSADDILAQAESEASGGGGKIVGSVADFPEFDESSKSGVSGDEKLEFLKDLQLNVYIELGRTKMQIKDIMELERGYVIELEKLASEPVDIFVNNKKIAEGEVVVIDKHFGIRITNLVETDERIKGL